MHTSVLSNEMDQNKGCNDDRNNYCQDCKYNCKRQNIQFSAYNYEVSVMQHLQEWL